MTSSPIRIIVQIVDFIPQCLPHLIRRKSTGDVHRAINSFSKLGRIPEVGTGVIIFVVICCNHTNQSHIIAPGSFCVSLFLQDLTLNKTLGLSSVRLDAQFLI